MARQRGGRSREEESYSHFSVAFDVYSYRLHVSLQQRADVLREPSYCEIRSLLESTEFQRRITTEAVPTSRRAARDGGKHPYRTPRY